jgi:hypothetical protein
MSPWTACGIGDPTTPLLYVDVSRRNPTIAMIKIIRNSRSIRNPSRVR